MTEARYRAALERAGLPWELLPYLQVGGWRLARVLAGLELGSRQTIVAAFSEDGRLLATHDGGAVRLWDVRTRRRVRLDRAIDLPVDALRLRGGRLLAVGLDVAAVFAIPSGERVATLASGALIDDACFLADGRIAAIDVEGAVTVFSAAGERLAWAASPVAVPENPDRYARNRIEPLGDGFVTGALGTDALSTWDASCRPRLALRGGGAFRNLAASGDEVVADVGAFVRFDARTGRVLAQRTVDLGPEPTDAMALLPGHVLVLKRLHERVHVLERETLVAPEPGRYSESLASGGDVTLVDGLVHDPRLDPVPPFPRYLGDVRVFLSPSGRRAFVLATGFERTGFADVAEEWLLPEGRPGRRFPWAGAERIAKQSYGPPCRPGFAAAPCGRVVVFERPDGPVAFDLETGAARPLDVDLPLDAVSPGGALAVTIHAGPALDDLGVSLVDLASGAARWRAPGPCDLAVARFSDDARRLVVLDDRRIRTWDVTSATPTAEEAWPDGIEPAGLYLSGRSRQLVRHLAWSGDRIAGALGDDSIVVIDAATAKVRRVIPPGPYVRGLRWVEGRLCVIGDDGCHLLDPDQGVLVGGVPVPGDVPLDLRFDAASDDERVHTLAVAGGRLLVGTDGGGLLLLERTHLPARSPAAADHPSFLSDDVLAFLGDDDARSARTPSSLLDVPRATTWADVDADPRWFFHLSTFFGLRDSRSNELQLRWRREPYVRAAILTCRRAGAPEAVLALAERWLEDRRPEDEAACGRVEDPLLGLPAFLISRRSVEAYAFDDPLTQVIDRLGLDREACRAAVCEELLPWARARQLRG